MFSSQVLFGLNWAKVGPISNRVESQNVFEVYSLSSATFVFWSELSSIPVILIRGLFGLNRAKLGPITNMVKFQNVF